MAKNKHNNNNKNWFSERTKKKTQFLAAKKWDEQRRHSISIDRYYTENFGVRLRLLVHSEPATDQIAIIMGTWKHLKWCIDPLLSYNDYSFTDHHKQ